MHEQFSDRARHAMALAVREVNRLHHSYVGPEHILLGLVAEGECMANVALQHLNVNIDTVRAELNRQLDEGHAPAEIGRRPYNPETRAVIEKAIYEARKLGHRYVGTEHLLLGLLQQDGNLAAKILRAQGVSLDGLREEVLATLRAVQGPMHDISKLKHGEFEWIHQEELAKAFKSADVWHTLILAVDSANRLGHGNMTAVHLLLGLLRNPEGEVSKLLAEKGVNADWVREQLLKNHT
jgi:ATP-dependent Clp protease ATP-binding subunit ClpA